MRTKPIFNILVAASQGTLFAVLLLTTVIALPAAEPTLKPGDPAPKLIECEWLQGGPITEFEKGKAYLVEFWATWCGPCADSIPHLNELHLKFKSRGLIVIGQNVEGKNQVKVKPFVAKMANQMKYPVALDYMSSIEGLTWDAWMGAAGQHGIPCAFLVGKDGRIAWIGHPDELSEKMIEEVLDGKFDVAKAAAYFLAEQDFEKVWAEFSQDIEEQRWDEALRLAERQGKTDTNQCHLKALAEGLLHNENLPVAALATSFELAVKANEGDLTKYTDEHRADHLNILARATFMKGEREKAIALQEKVVALMAGPTVDKADKAAYQSNLDSYKAGHLKKEKTITPMLKAGDPAPQLAVGGWVQGGPITELSKGKAYLVEFWATWCGPCVASIPHLNELHLKFKDKGLVVIGQNVSEQDQTVVKPFVTRMGNKMTYPVALDNVTESSKGSMKENWLNAAGQNGIPCAFLVAKDGKLAWIGYPSELTEKMVEDVLAGTFDASKVAVTAPSPEKNTPKSREEERAETWREFNDDIQKMNWDAAALLARKLSVDEADPWQLLSLASGLLENESLRGEPLEAAYTMADKANQAMILGEDNRRGKARHLQVLARAAFMKDQRNKAITLLKEAIGLIDDPDGNSNYMSVLQSTLCDYEAGHLPKTIVDEVQPDEKNWALLRTGMSEREVVKLIGEPMQAKQANSGERVYVLQWGHVKYHSPCMPGGFAFLVLFANGKVERFGDPFGAPPSSDGIPTTPQPEFPLNGKAVHDIGRFVDYRWTPSSGKHPVSYDIEEQVDESFEPNKRIWGARSLFSVDLPYVSDTRPNQTFRWRVRAKNPLGASEWSQWQEVSERDIRTKTADAITSKSMPAPALSMRPQDARTDAIRVAKFKDDLASPGRQAA
jgi:thiol-disulfide isomerase/thioredoxin